MKSLPKYKHVFSGSITLEASIVLPLYLFALLALCSLMQMIRLHADINMATYSAAKEIALYAYGEELVDQLPIPELKNIVNTVISDTYASSVVEAKLNNENELIRYIDGGLKGLSYLRSTIKINGDVNDIVDFAISYKIQPLCNFFGINQYNMLNRIRLHPWTGYSYTDVADDNSERIVYITENGTVYHLSKSCTHLDLNIEAISSSNKDSYRNANGSKYKACQYCMKNGGNNGNLFITKQGDCYHSSLSCSGLKRTIIAISIKDVGNKPLCSRCKGGM